MLKGFLTAAAHRYPLRMGVTAGYDSRVLFLASLGLDCAYYVSKLDGNEIDIAISHQLVEAHGKQITIAAGESNVSEDLKLLQDQSLDFPRYRNHNNFESNSMLINGNVSEIARCFYGRMEGVTVDDLLFCEKYQGDPFVRKVFQEWLETNSTLFEVNGLHVLDMFYWEERMGNWAAKGKTESSLSTSIYSPFCSRKLLVTLLSTSRKDRDSHFNVLYDEMIRAMSPAAVKIPINPTAENRRIRLLKNLGMFYVLKHVARRYRQLRRWRIEDQ
jgi:hypothetical protein